MTDVDTLYRDAELQLRRAIVEVESLGMGFQDYPWWGEFCELSRALNLATVPPLEAIRNVVNYNWSDELGDFNAQDEDGREHHIFRDLQAIVRWLDSKGAA